MTTYKFISVSEQDWFRSLIDMMKPMMIYINVKKYRGKCVPTVSLNYFFMVLAFISVNFESLSY
jgi:hypothetical protein